MPTRERIQDSSKKDEVQGEDRPGQAVGICRYARRLLPAARRPREGGKQCFSALELLVDNSSDIICTGSRTKGKASTTTNHNCACRTSMRRSCSHFNHSCIPARLRVSDGDPVSLFTSTLLDALAVDTLRAGGLDFFLPVFHSVAQA